MAKITLTVPQSLDPRQVASIDIGDTLFRWRDQKIDIPVIFLDASGNQLAVQNITADVADFPVIATYLANRKSEILTRVQSRYGFAGTIA